MHSDLKKVNLHYETQFKQWLEEKANDPILIAMKMAIQLYPDRSIRLTKALKYSFSTIKHKTKGLTIKKDALSLFPKNAQELLQSALDKDCHLVSFGVFIFTLPSDRFEFLDKTDQVKFI